MSMFPRDASRHLHYCEFSQGPRASVSDSERSRHRPPTPTRNRRFCRRSWTKKSFHTCEPSWPENTSEPWQTRIRTNAESLENVGIRRKVFGGVRLGLAEGVGFEPTDPG